MKTPDSKSKGHLLGVGLPKSKSRIQPDATTRQRNGPIGVLCLKLMPPLSVSGELIDSLNSSVTTVITRHFPEEYLESVLGGDFRFGTIHSYKPADTAQIGRFSDAQEGTQRESFASRTGLYKNINIGNNNIINISFEDEDRPVVIEYQVNDYCSCSSIGKFDKDRALRLRSMGNPDISAYAEYDVVVLKKVLKEILSARSGSKDLSLVGRNVEYGDKDRYWEIESSFTQVDDPDPAALWLGTAFVKSQDYQHEEEFRLLATNPNAVGSLDPTAPGLVLQDARLAVAIIGSGKF